MRRRARTSRRLQACGLSTALAAVTLTALAFTGCAAERSDGPHPELSPEQVVSRQVELLQRVAGGDEGALAAAMRFASPANLRAVGTPRRFRDMLENPLYAPLLEHRDATVGEGRPRNGDVQVRVEVTGRDGRVSAFLYTLARHDVAGCAGCWLVEGVVPQARPGESPRPAPAVPPDVTA